MPSVIFQEFRDQYALTKYPFVDTATCTDRTGALVLPPGILLDASIFIPGVSSFVYLSKLEITAEYFIVTVSDTSGKKQITGKRYTSDTTSNLSLFSDYGFLMGMLVSDNLRWAFLHSLPAGTYEFGNNTTRFVDKCTSILPTMGVTTVGIEDTEGLTGDIWLVGRNGVVLRAENETTIRIDVAGEALFNRTSCGESFVTPNYVTSINGCRSDRYGNIQLIVEQDENTKGIIRLNSSTDSITLSAIGTTNK